MSERGATQRRCNRPAKPRRTSMRCASSSPAADRPRQTPPSAEAPRPPQGRASRRLQRGTASAFLARKLRENEGACAAGRRRGENARRMSNIGVQKSRQCTFRAETAQFSRHFRHTCACSSCEAVCERRRREIGGKQRKRRAERQATYPGEGGGSSCARGAWRGPSPRARAPGGAATCALIPAG